MQEISPNPSLGISPLPGTSPKPHPSVLKVEAAHHVPPLLALELEEMKAICQETALGAIVAQWICKASKDRTLSVGFGFQVLGFVHDHGILGKYQLVEVVEAFRDSANPPRRPQKSNGNRTEPISTAVNSGGVP